MAEFITSLALYYFDNADEKEIGNIGVVHAIATNAEKEVETDSCHY